MGRHPILEQPISQTIPNIFAAVSRNQILGVDDQLRHQGIDSLKGDMTI